MRYPPRLRFLLGALAGPLLLALLLGMGGAAAAKPRGGQIQVHEHTKLAAPSSRARCPRSRAQRRQLRRRYRRAQRQGKRRLARIAKGCSRAAPQAAGPSSIYWGAWLGRHLTGEEAPWDMSAVDEFEQIAGKRASIVHFGSPFSNCYSSRCYFYDFPTDPMESVREHGSIPFLSWSSQSIPSDPVEPDYQLGDVARGDYDSYIRDYAEDAAAWGHPFFLRFNWEMNGDWFSWGAGANGNSAADSVAAWRHVHDIFTSAGATNATWVWCPNVDPGGDMVDIASLYPGDSYVDWTCLDGYNWGTGPSSPNSWASFDELYRSTYDRIVGEIAPSKPMIIGETAASEYGGSKAGWIADMLGKIPAEYPGIRGLLWFERYDDGMDWPLETSEGATSAFAAGIQNPAYATNSFAGLSLGGPIPPSG